MNIHIINIGDELLIGQVVNTNAAWMAAALNANGMLLTNIATVGDTVQAITSALNIALKSADVVLMTGGLGPTKDDITKTTLARFFDSPLIMDSEALENVRKIFEQRGLPLTATNRTQAEVPACCEVIINKHGTAPCMWFEHQGKVVVAMPGVPYEMQQLMTGDIIPRLKSHFQSEHFLHKTVLTYGIGESFLSDKLAGFEAQLPAHIKLAYLPNMGIIRLRLSANGNNINQLEIDIKSHLELLLSCIGEYVWGYDDDTFELAIGKMLCQSGATLAVAESCTGGYISHLITSVAGSSAYFRGGAIAYHNDIKENLLEIPTAYLTEYGAVSRQTAEAMALGVQKHFNSDYAIATTGIAGPSGGTEAKPVGTVWIAIATAEGVHAAEYHFPATSRIHAIYRASTQALNNLLKILSDNI